MRSKYTLWGDRNKLYFCHITALKENIELMRIEINKTDIDQKLTHLDNSKTLHYEVEENIKKYPYIFDITKILYMSKILKIRWILVNRQEVRSISVFCLLTSPNN